MRATTDVIVVGSGPTGICCCWPLLHAGLRVLLIDPGGPIAAVPADRPGLADVRAGHPGKSTYLLGGDLRALRISKHPSPKLRIAAPPHFVSDYIDALRVSTNGFVLAGSLAPGGLSNVWGSVASVYDDADLAGTPLRFADLSASYSAVSRRIGISGTKDDDMAPFHGDIPLQPPIPNGALAAELLARYRRRGAGRAAMKLGFSRNAVLSLPLDGRKACERDGFCMWGCRRGAIYNSAHEIDSLSAFATFTYRPGCLVERIEPTGDGYRLEGRNPATGKGVAHVATRVVLAAGTVASTRLVLPLLARLGERRRLLNNPAYTFAVLFPSGLGRAAVAGQFAMAQLSYILPIAAGDSYTAGVLYPADCLSPVDIADEMPTTLRGGMLLARSLAPAMLIGLGYFDGALSDNRIVVDAGVDGLRVHIDGGWARSFSDALAETRSKLRRVFLRLGGILLPGSLNALPPGGDSHYAGTLAMGDLLTRDCEVAARPGVYVVDGAAFNRLPAKHCTLTLMANADRVGGRIAVSAFAAGRASPVHRP